MNINIIYTKYYFIPKCFSLTSRLNILFVCFGYVKWKVIPKILKLNKKFLNI